MKRVAAAIGAETRAYGIMLCLSPVAEPAKDPRWGRVEETFGEDHHLGKLYKSTFITVLASRLITAYVSGMQGESLNSSSSAIAEAKHYIGYAKPEGGRNVAPATIGMRELHTEFVPIFKAAVKEAGGKGIMAAYSEIDGIPSSMNTYTLTDILRGELGFQGIVISDLGAISMLRDVHMTAYNTSDAVRLYLEAGGNVQFYDFSHDEFQHGIVDMVEKNIMKQEILDIRVLEVLHVKELLGLFNNPITDTNLVPTVVNCKKHRDLALESARESIVLLKNHHGILPLKKDLKKILVVGPSSGEVRLGDYTGMGGSVNNLNNVPLVEGIKRYLKNTTVVHRWGTGIQNDVELYPIHWYSFTHPDKSKPGLLGKYYSNTNFTGETVELDVPELNLKYVYGYKAIQKFPLNTYSAVFTGILTPDITVVGKLRLDTDDSTPGKLYVNGKLFVDTSTPTHEKTFNFEEGVPIDIRVEYVRKEMNADHTVSIELQWSLTGEHGIEDAVAAAKDVDAIIVAVGENDSTVGEGLDSTRINLPGRQEELVQKLHATGKPLVVVLMHGRPLAIPWVYKNVEGIISSYFAGQAQGVALTDVLFGDYNPGGRLPITIPKEVGQIPIFYNRKPSSFHNYVETDPNPQYSFGYGLSYTTFEYENLVVTPKQIPTNGQVKVSIDVKNTGHREGDEVVQLYVRDIVASVTTPVKQLRGLERIHLNQSEVRTVTFVLDAMEHLAIFGHQMKWIVEPGVFNVMVGPSSDNIKQNANFEVV